MTSRTKWCVALLLSGLSVAGLITASVAVSQEPQPPATANPAGSSGLPGAAIAPGAPAAGAAPLGIPAASSGGPAPATPTAPVGRPPVGPPTGGAPFGGPQTGPPSAIPALPTVSVAPTESIRFVPPLDGPGPASVTEPGPAESTLLNTLTGAGGTSRLQVVGLKHANPQAVREVIETLMPATRGLVATDLRTNTLILRVPQGTYDEIERLVQVLDAAVPNVKSKSSEANNSGSGYLPAGKPVPGGMAPVRTDGAYYAGFTTRSTAELRQEYERHERAARELAEAIKGGAVPQVRRAELRERVADAFAARQQLLRAEVAEFLQRLKASQESIDLRDRVGNQIVDRRVNELLDPSLQWEPASGLLSETSTGMKGRGPTAAQQAVEDDTFHQAPGAGLPSMRPSVTDPRLEHPNLFNKPGTLSRGFGGRSPEAAVDPDTRKPTPAADFPAKPIEQDAEADPFEIPSRKPALTSDTPVTPSPRQDPSSNLGNLRGRVVFEGSFTTLPPLYKKGDAPKDTSICGANEIPDERILINHANGLANVFVYLEKAPAGTTPPPVAGPLILDQSGCIFQPRALIVRTDQVIHAFNSDPIAHNVHTYSIKNAATNMILGPNDQTGVSLKYPVPEKEPFAVGCDIHPWMKAYHLPLNHNFGAVTDANGDFEITGLPVGTHKFKVWHEVGKMLDRALEVTITAGDNDIQIPVKSGQLQLGSPAAPGGPLPRPEQGGLNKF